MVQVAEIASSIAGRPLDSDLQTFLRTTYPDHGPAFHDLEQLIATGVAEGWLCQREAGGIRFGRVVKPGGEAGRFSVDVVLMDDIRGPHHAHPQGEIGMILPVEGAPMFDGHPRGWYVYPPGSDHWPTVSGGKAYVLYLLPEGAIEFTGR